MTGHKLTFWEAFALGLFIALAVVFLVPR